MTPITCSITRTTLNVPWRLSASYMEARADFEDGDPDGLNRINALVDDFTDAIRKTAPCAAYFPESRIVTVCWSHGGLDLDVIYRNLVDEWNDNPPYESLNSDADETETSALKCDHCGGPVIVVNGWYKHDVNHWDLEDRGYHGCGYYDPAFAGSYCEVNGREETQSLA